MKHSETDDYCMTCLEPKDVALAVCKACSTVDDNASTSWPIICPACAAK